MGQPMGHIGLIESENYGGLEDRSSEGVDFSTNLLKLDRTHFRPQQQAREVRQLLQTSQLHYRHRDESDDSRHRTLTNRFCNSLKHVTAVDYDAKRNGFKQSG